MGFTWVLFTFFFQPGFLGQSKTNCCWLTGAMLLLLSLLAVAANLNLSHHILVFHGFGSKSNLLLFAPLMEELLDRGNRVTSILFSSVGIEHENLTEIVLETDTGVLTARLSNLVMQKPGFSFQTFLVLIQIVFYSRPG